MTKYRHPYDRKLQPDRLTRPPLPVWLRGDTPADASYSLRISRAYWLKLYRATPPWLTDEQVDAMRAVYDGANPRFEHVDHIVPLKHPLVCGLNVPWNLQRVPWRENLSKSNHYWPDCPDHLCPIRNLPADMFAGAEPHQLGLGL